MIKVTSKQRSWCLLPEIPWKEDLVPRELVILVELTEKTSQNIGMSLLAKSHLKT